MGNYYDSDESSKLVHGIDNVSFDVFTSSNN